MAAQTKIQLKKRWADGGNRRWRLNLLLGPPLCWRGELRPAPRGRCLGADPSSRQRHPLPQSPP